MEETEPCLQKMYNHFSKTTVDEVFNDQSLCMLLAVLSKEDTLEEKKLQVNCALAILLSFIILDVSEDKWKEEAIYLGTLCKFLLIISVMYIEDQDIVAQVLLTCSALPDYTELVDSVLDQSFEVLLWISIGSTVSSSNKLSSLILISVLLENATWSLCEEIIPSMMHLIKYLEIFLLLCGNYHTQEAIFMVLALCWWRIKELPEHEKKLFKDCPHMRKLFKDCIFLKSQDGSRLFLNQLNCGIVDSPKVFPAPCLMIAVDNIVYNKLSDSMYEAFWVDFNSDPKSISFYHQQSHCGCWVLKTYYENTIVSIKATNSQLKVEGDERLSAVKLIVTAKSINSSQETMEVAAIYFEKCMGFIVLERSAIKPIFEAKYKSEVTYEEVVINWPDKWSACEKIEPKSNEVKPISESVTMEHTESKSELETHLVKTYSRPKSNRKRQTNLTLAVEANADYFPPVKIPTSKTLYLDIELEDAHKTTSSKETSKGVIVGVGNQNEQDDRIQSQWKSEGRIMKTYSRPKSNKKRQTSYALAVEANSDNVQPVEIPTSEQLSLNIEIEELHKTTSSKENSKGEIEIGLENQSEQYDLIQSNWEFGAVCCRMMTYLWPKSNKKKQTSLALSVEADSGYFSPIKVPTSERKVSHLTRKTVNGENCNKMDFEMKVDLMEIKNRSHADDSKTELVKTLVAKVNPKKVENKTDNWKSIKQKWRKQQRNISDDLCEGDIRINYGDCSTMVCDSKKAQVRSIFQMPPKQRVARTDASRNNELTLAQGGSASGVLVITLDD